MKYWIVLLMVIFSTAVIGQKVEDIYFNLYTDSLKKGVHNYINVDAKLANGSYLPLMTDEIKFTSTYGKWEGNSIIIDSAFCLDSIIVTAQLIKQPDLTKVITIYMKKNLVEPALKTEKELLDEWNKKKKN
jgi:hypothetical protein